MYLSGIGMCSYGDGIETVGLLDVNIRSAHLHSHTAPVQLQKKVIIIIIGQYRSYYILYSTH